MRLLGGADSVADVAVGASVGVGVADVVVGYSVVADPATLATVVGESASGTVGAVTLEPGDVEPELRYQVKIQARIAMITPVPCQAGLLRMRTVLSQRRRMRTIVGVSLL